MAEATVPESPDFPDVPPGAAPKPAPPPARPERRAAGWQHLGKLHCPAGHLITRRDTFLTGTLIARCECGRAILAVAIANLLTAVQPTSSLVYTLEITRAEAGWMQREHPPLDEVLDRAGLFIHQGAQLRRTDG